MRIHQKIIATVAFVIAITGALFSFSILTVRSDTQNNPGKGTFCFRNVCLAQWNNLLKSKDMSDKDGDGVFNADDKCDEPWKIEAGKPVLCSYNKSQAEFDSVCHEGCGDKDSDGVWDNKDNCKSSAAPGTPFGCPTLSNSNITFAFNSLSGPSSVEVIEGSGSLLFWEISLPGVAPADYRNYVVSMSVNGSTVFNPSAVQSDWYAKSDVPTNNINGKTTFTLHLKAPGTDISKSITADVKVLNGEWSTPACPALCGTSKVTRTCTNYTNSGTGCSKQSGGYTKDTEVISCDGTSMGTDACAAYPGLEQFLFSMVDWDYNAGVFRTQHECTVDIVQYMNSDADYVYYKDVNATDAKYQSCESWGCVVHFNKGCSATSYDVEIVSVNLSKAPYAVTQKIVTVQSPVVKTEQEACYYSNQTLLYPTCQDGVNMKSLDRGTKRSCLGTSTTQCMYTDGRICGIGTFGATSYSSLHCRPTVVEKSVNHYYIDTFVKPSTGSSSGSNSGSNSSGDTCTVGQATVPCKDRSNISDAPFWFLLYPGR